MKVKVQYTVKVDRFERIGIGNHIGKDEKANRDDIKYFLEYNGVGALDDMSSYGQMIMKSEEDND